MKSYLGLRVYDVVTQFEGIVTGQVQYITGCESVGRSFLEIKGRILLQWYRDNGTDAGAWPDWWCTVPSGVEW